MNTGVPFSAYTAAPYFDPGNDGIPGTTDDATILVYNRDPAFLGKDFFLLTNPAERDGTTKGFQIAISKTFGEKWQAALYFNAMKSAAPTNPGNSVFENDPGVIGNLGADPNTFLFANSTTFFDRGYTAKLGICYHAPAHFAVGIVARYYDGLPYGRLLLVHGLNQGPFYLRVTPRDNFPEGFRTEFNGSLDARISREFPLGGNRVLLSLDFFNLLNMSNRTIENDLTGPEFRFPVTIQAPRTIVLGLQWKF